MKHCRIAIVGASKSSVLRHTELIMQEKQKHVEQFHRIELRGYDIDHIEINELEGCFGEGLIKEEKSKRKEYPLTKAATSVSLSCPVCERPFSTEAGLNVHVERKHYKKEL